MFDHFSCKEENECQISLALYIRSEFRLLCSVVQVLVELVVRIPVPITHFIRKDMLNDMRLNDINDTDIL